jgi:hypothetical protein
VEVSGPLDSPFAESPGPCEHRDGGGAAEGDIRGARAPAIGGAAPSERQGELSR